MDRQIGESYTVRSPLYRRIVRALGIGVIIGIIILFVIISLLIFNVSDLTLLLLLITFLLIPIILFVWHKVFFQRLVISPTGITLYHVGIYQIEFDNLYYLTDGQFYSKKDSLKWAGIELKHAVPPLKPKSRWLKMWYFLVFPSQLSLIPLAYVTDIHIRHNLLTSKIDIEHLQQTKLGCWLQYYAPHLFEDDNERKLKNRLDDDYSDDEQLYWNDDSQLSDKQYG
ncbi:MAG: hypothetical protein AAFV93_23335 [Chloroflexota bacterium]